jgi:multisubunit Na+/H+ antiporter MnhE subunit
MSARTGPEGGGGVRGAVLAWIAWWVVCAVLWLLLVDNTHVPELIVGAGVAAFGASAAVGVRQQRRVVLRPRLRWVLRLWRPLASFPRDTWLVARALVRSRRVEGRFLAIPVSQRDDPPTRNHARRVMIQTAASLAPNTYVIGTDFERGLVLVHQLVPTDDPLADADPLGLR